MENYIETVVVLYFFTRFIRTYERKTIKHKNTERMIRVNDELTRTQYIILNILKASKATNHMLSMTLAEIAEQEGRNKINTIYKHIRVLVEKGFVLQGARVEKAYSYYISERGITLLQKFKDTEVTKDDEAN